MNEHVLGTSCKHDLLAQDYAYELLVALEQCRAQRDAALAAQRTAEAAAEGALGQADAAAASAMALSLQSEDLKAREASVSA